MPETIEFKAGSRTWLPIVALLSGVCLSLPVQAEGEFADTFVQIPQIDGQSHLLR